ncbi:LuxR family transcriptional regulator [uncultured Roseovarius sp.]|uniref:LuxR family transcriptional regulator n=1 Tax=uncultured Roseovarius sp. TaxID=293344 RepID=UPI0025CFA13E|nr:LuxR family transcriptional regulator [uncultured Roseovarius sp.]
MIDPARLNNLLNAPGIEALWDMHCRQMAEFGFDRLLYGFTRYRTATTLGDPEDFVLLSNHEPAYITGFIEDRLYADAPMVKWALENDGACSWSWIQSLDLTPAEQNVLAFNKAHDVTAGYSVSFKSVSPRAKGAIALTATPDLDQQAVDELWAEQGEIITALNTVVHLRILSLPYNPPGRALTKRQREVLEWVGDGKTVQDTALLMELTPATVEKHLRLAREALSVETTAQAVLKAAFHNQMFIVER